MQIIILDEGRKTLCDCTNKYSDEKYIIGPCFQNTKSMLKYLAENKIQAECLIIIAIQSAGMAEECEEALMTIKATRADIKWILCMGVLNHLDRLFKLSPASMLSLPLDYQILRESIEACYKDFMQEHGKYIVISKNGKDIYIDADSIIYVESKGRQLEVNLVHNKKILFYMQMERILEKLPDYFVRCHQSFSVNTRYVKTFTGEKLILFCKKEIPVSKRYRKKWNKPFTKGDQK